MAARRLAALGGAPAFCEPLPVGQLYFPSWERYVEAMRGIFDRGWYTNHGPLAREAEQRLAAFFGVRHAITVTNATVGLMMAIRCLGIEGKVVVPGFTFIATAQAVTWNGLDVVFCDVDRETQQVTPQTLADALSDDVGAVVAVNLWGGTCNPAAVVEFARERNLKVIFDSAHAAGVRTGGVPLGGFGDVEVFSLHATKVLNATEGGCVCTNDDELAAQLRNMRSSYGAGAPVAVPLTSNGRFSEAQAAIALMSLEDFERNRDHNERIHSIYRERLQGIAGVRLLAPVQADRSNYQYAVVEIEPGLAGLTRDSLVAALGAEHVLARRYFTPGAHRTIPYVSQNDVSLPVTELLCERLLQLPLGALVSEETAMVIADLVSAIQGEAQAVTAALAAAR